MGTRFLHGSVHGSERLKIATGEVISLRSFART